MDKFMNALRQPKSPLKQRFKSWVSNLPTKVLNVLVRCHIASVQSHIEWEDKDFTEKSIINALKKSVEDSEIMITNWLSYKLMLCYNYFKFKVVGNEYKIGKCRIKIATHYHWAMGRAGIRAICDGIAISEIAATKINEHYGSHYEDTDTFHYRGGNYSGEELEKQSRLINIAIPMSLNTFTKDFIAPNELSFKNLTINLSEFDLMYQHQFINGNIFIGTELEEIVSQILYEIVPSENLMTHSWYIDILCRCLNM